MLELAPLEAVWTLFVAIAIHRLWIHEDIFEAPRAWADRIPVYAVRMMFTCSECFAFWAGILALTVTVHREVTSLGVLWWSLGYFALIRGAIAFYKTPPLDQMPALPLLPVDKKASDMADTMLSKAWKAVDTVRSLAQPCTTCGKGAPKSAIIMTSFGDFQAAYSLVTCVLDQARALSAIGYRVELWVNQGCSMAGYPLDMPSTVFVLPNFPPVPCQQDVVDEAGVKTLVDFMDPELQAKRPDVIIAHDLVFQTWFVTIAAAIHRLKPLPGTQWFHQVHSGPALPRTVPPGAYHRMTIPKGHRVICVNYADRLRFAEYFDVAHERIISIPNARDMSVWAHMSEDGKTAVQALHLDEADFVQVYAVSGTRMDAKGLGTVIDVFAALKSEFAYKVRLVVANGHSTDDKVKAAIEQYKERATKAGLEAGEDLVFTSEVFPQWANGVPGSVVADLQHYMNVFVFPTIAEAGSLVLMEAALAGALLILNQDVPALADVIPHDQARWFGFGNNKGKPCTAVPGDVAAAIDAEYKTSPVLRAKRTVVQYQCLRQYGARLKAAIERQG